MGVMGGMIPFITGRGPPCKSNVPTSTRCNLRSCDLKAVMLADQTFLAGFFGPTSCGCVFLNKDEAGKNGENAIF